MCPRSNTEAPCAREPQPRLGVPIYLVRSLLRAGICTRGQPMRRLPGWTIPRPEALIPNPRARNNEPLISSRYQGDQAYSLKGLAAGAPNFRNVLGFPRTFPSIPRAALRRKRPVLRRMEAPHSLCDHQQPVQMLFRVMRRRFSLACSLASIRLRATSASAPAASGCASAAV